MPIRAVLWDFDGVLNLNTTRGQFRWSTDFEATFGHPLAGFQEAVFSDMPPLLTGKARIEDRIAAWIEKTGANTTPDAVLAHWYDRDVYPNPRLKTLTAQLAKRGITQAILTNQDNRRTALAEWATQFFDGITQVVSSSRIGYAKPAPEAFEAARAALDRPPGAILFVDDSAGHINAARALGFRTFRYSPLAQDALDRVLNL